MALAVWTAASVALFIGQVAPPHAGAITQVLVVGVPAVLVLGLLLMRTEAPPLMRLAAGWTVIVAVGLLFATVLSVQPVAALVVPGILAIAAVALRYPTAIVLLLFAITGAYGSIQAFTALSTGKVADGLLAGLWVSVLLALVMRRRERPMILWPGIAFVALYVFLTAMEILTAQTPSFGLQAFRSSTWYLAAVLLLAYAGFTPGTWRRIARGMVFVAFLVGAYATFRWIVGPAPEEKALALKSIGQYNDVNGKLTLFGSFSSRHALAAWTAAAVPFCTASALTFRGRWRILAAAAAALCAVGLLGTEVRIALAAVVLGTALILLLYQVARAFPGLHLGATAGAVFAVIAVGAGLYALTTSGSAGQRYEALLNPSQDANYQARVHKWDTVLNDVDTHPLGHGIGTGGRVQRDYGQFSNISTVDIDNGYLKVAFEQGPGVMVLYIAGGLLLLFGLARRAVLTRDPARAGIGIASAGALFAFLIMLLSSVYSEDLVALGAWMMAAVGVAQFTVREPAEKVTEVAPPRPLPPAVADVVAPSGPDWLPPGGEPRPVA